MSKPIAYSVKAYATPGAQSPLGPTSISRREPTDRDVQIDFFGQHNITADIEMIRMDQINEAYERMLRKDVKYRFVIDLASLR